MKKMTCVIFILLYSGLTLSQSENGKISGLVYTDYFYNAVRDTGLTGLPNVSSTGRQDLNGFDLRRLYFTYDYRISELFDSRFRIEADGRTLSPNNRFTVFIKDAFIRWREVLPGQDVIFGIQPTPAFEISESVYGFRSLEKTIMDLRGIVSSRDFGISLKGRVITDLNYWLMFANNAGSSPETNKYKRIYSHLNYKLSERFTATLYADVLFRTKIKSTIDNYSLLDNNSITTAFFLGYSDKNMMNLGAEAFYQTNDNNLIIDSSYDNRSALGVSLFGSLKLLEKVVLTLRYDLYDPAVNSDIEHDMRTLYILGLSYKPAEAVSIIPNIIIEEYEDLAERSVNASVTPRLTLSYTF